MAFYKNEIKYNTEYNLAQFLFYFVEIISIISFA